MPENAGPTTPLIITSKALTLLEFIDDLTNLCPLQTVGIFGSFTYSATFGSVHLESLPQRPPRPQCNP